jgi:hypothetical protein
VGLCTYWLYGLGFTIAVFCTLLQSDANGCK